LGQGVFLSTYEKQLDGKRRLLIPQEFRTADNGAEHGVFCFFALADDCLEAGGDRLGEDVVIVGLGPRFQIWDRARWNARRDARRALARQVMNGEAG
jgi:MraZ protein